MVAGFIIFIMDFLLRVTDNYPTEPEFHSYLASVWLIILLFNLIIISFDFSLGKTFTIFVTIAFISVLYIVGKEALFPDGLSVLPSFKTAVSGLDISASANFYLTISLMLFFIFIGTWLVSHFNYWEFESNRIIHHRGVFEREESFSAQNSRVITSTDDIFERLLFRAGTIHIIDPEKKLHVINNVYNAVGKDHQIQDLLSVVRVRSDMT
jgi:hypothetical protein